MASKDFQLKTSIVVDSTGMKAGLEAAATATREFATGIKAETSKMSFAFRDVSEMGIGEMRKEMMKLRNVSFAGKTKEEITAINMRIGELMDTMGDLKAVQKGMGVELGTAMAGGLQTISAMAEAGVGVASMFGASKESAEKYQQVMVSLIGVTQSAGVIEDALATRQLQTIAIRIQQSVVTAAQTVATQAATAAQWLYNASLLVVIGTIGAVVVVVGALVAGIYYLAKGFNDSTDAAERQIEAYERLEQKNNSLNSQNEFSLKLLRAKGATQNELSKAEIKLTEERQSALQKEFRAFEQLNSDQQADKREAYNKGIEEFKKNDENIQILKASMVTAERTKQESIGKTTTKLEAGTEAQKAYNEQLKEYNKLVAASVTEITQGEINGDKGITPLKSKGISGNSGILTPRDNSSINSLGKELTEAEKAMARYQELLTDMNAIVKDGLNSLAGSFSQGIADMITGDSGLSGFLAGIMGGIGGFLQQMGAAVVAYAITMEAFKKAFTNPYVALAAGIGLMIVGGVVKNYAAKLEAGKFAQGGIVGGNSFSGDQVSARVNSGEMILNGGQQARLFAMANGESQGQNIQIFGRLKAGDIYLSNKRGAYISNRRG